MSGTHHIHEDGTEHYADEDCGNYDRSDTPTRPVRPIDLPALICARMTKLMPKRKGRCQVFLKCQRTADTHIDHPVLGEVPACDECQIWYERES